MKEKDFIPTSGMGIDKKLLFDTHPLTLSFIGDAVHTAYIRSKICYETLSLHPDNNTLHTLCSKSVCAKSQSRIARLLPDILTEEELFIFKKAKNAKTNTLPKNVTLAEYHLATALEAVFGFLYLAGEGERLAELLQYINEHSGNQSG